MAASVSIENWKSKRMNWMLFSYEYLGIVGTLLSTQFQQFSRKQVIFASSPVSSIRQKILLVKFSL